MSYLTIYDRYDRNLEINYIKRYYIWDKSDMEVS